MSPSLILFIVFLAIAVAVTVVRQRARWRAQCRAAAEKIHGEMAAMYGGEQQFRAVRQEDFPGIDLARYHEAREFLTAHGFNPLGSIENVTMTQVYPANRTFMAAYVDEPGTTCAYFYQVQGIHVQDFSSALEDGRFLLTTNATIDKLTPAPSVSRETLPATATQAQLLARHQERVAALRAAEPRAAWRTVHTMDEVLDACRGYSRVVGAHRRSFGLLAEDEILRLAAPGQEPTARLVFQHFRELVEHGRSGPA